MEKLPEGFEIIFITEGDDASPAAEIQFNGQRLLILREASEGVSEIEFVSDKYVLKHEVLMKFPLQAFRHVVTAASTDLRAWCINFVEERAQQTVQPDRA